MRTSMGVAQQGSRRADNSSVFADLVIVTCQIDSGGPTWYFSDALLSYLCHTSTDAIESRPGLSFDGPTSLEYDSGKSSIGIVLVQSWFVFLRSGCAECVITQLTWLTPSLYNISLDLHPRLPPAEVVVLELPNDVIAIYHRMFDFSWVRIPFSSFLLSVIKHFKVQLSQIGHRGLNKARHADLVITDLKPLFGSYDALEVRKLSAFILKLRDMPKVVLFLSGLSRVWKSLTYDPILRDSNGNVMGIYDFLCLPKWGGSKVQEEPHHHERSTLERLPFYCTLVAAIGSAIPDPTSESLLRLLMILRIVHTERGDGVANFKRRRQDFQSDDVIDLTTSSGRCQLKVALEDST
ncbi:hypothetical protein Tco_1138166 [Tanacetum coccineum]